MEIPVTDTWVISSGKVVVSLTDTGAQLNAWWLLPSAVERVVVSHSVVGSVEIGSRLDVPHTHKWISRRNLNHVNTATWHVVVTVLASAWVETSGADHVHLTEIILSSQEISLRLVHEIDVGSSLVPDPNVLLEIETIRGPVLVGTSSVIDGLSSIVDKKPSVTGRSVKGPSGLSLEWDHCHVVVDISGVLLFSHECEHVVSVSEASYFLTSVNISSRVALSRAELS